MNDEFNEIEKELARYRPADFSDDLMRRTQAQMHRPSVRRWTLKDRIFAATVAAGILATCINVGLLASSFWGGVSEPDDQSMVSAVQTSHSFAPMELAWLQRQSFLNESGGDEPAQFLEH
ncbi:MAG TPA: hypothetical protein VMG59_10070 [Phycisphaerae bacterium]|nr:hypothetical protein [Phycisphaerae bacterium]